MRRKKTSLGCHWDSPLPLELYHDSKIFSSVREDARLFCHNHRELGDVISTEFLGYSCILSAAYRPICLDVPATASTRGRAGILTALNPAMISSFPSPLSSLGGISLLRGSVSKCYFLSFGYSRLSILENSSSINLFCKLLLRFDALKNESQKDLQNNSTWVLTHFP